MPTPLYRREILSRIPNDRPVVGAEIGVWAGELSRFLLTNRPQLTLLLFDPWREYTPLWRRSQMACDAARRKSEAVADEFGERAVLRCVASPIASRLVADESLDFFFLDASHEPESIKNDIAAWLPKLTPDGWYGGRGFSEQWLNTPNDVRCGLATAGRDRTWFVNSPINQPQPA